MNLNDEFSYRSREAALGRFREEEFDLLVVGGGITGVAVARDAVSRGLKVALVEKGDFASGTSSVSSKLIHGGLRYLENYKVGLVFESLSERALLLKSSPLLVRPLQFMIPLYQGESPRPFVLSMGLWFYDVLSLFRTPGFHKRLSKKTLLEKLPYLKHDGLIGGFTYFDASMWDDVLTVETARAAHRGGAAIANYVEAVFPIWQKDRIHGFRVRDREGEVREDIELRARNVVVCVGPWTDLFGEKISKAWEPWLEVSKGVHLVFDLKRLPVPGAVVLGHTGDGRFVFVIPRPDFGSGVAIVGTTDGPTDPDPEKSGISQSDVQYLLNLLNKYFPGLKLGDADVINAYVGVRPLLGWQEAPREKSSKAFQKISREHHIRIGPGGTVWVAGGKYTTHRNMAEEIVDFTLKHWFTEAAKGTKAAMPTHLRRSSTRVPVNSKCLRESVAQSRSECERLGLKIPELLWDRYGAEAQDLVELTFDALGVSRTAGDPGAFPLLENQFLHAMRHSSVLHLEDFFIRRTALFLSRADHGLPWAEKLALLWARERGFGEDRARVELKRLQGEIERRTAWKREGNL